MTNHPSKTKQIAAALALLCLSGCCNETDYRESAEACCRKGGIFSYSCQADSPFSASVTVSCKGIPQPYFIHETKK